MGPAASSISLRARYRGCLLGLAAGDAVGTTLEFRAPGTFQPIGDMVGGGPFGLRPGEWTDDTSMALCLAASLVERQGFDARDQMERYVRWYREGYFSSTGRCFDIGNTTRAALASFERTGNPLSGPTDSRSAGNGSIMRLAPVPLFFSADRRQAVEMAAESSRTTHGTQVAVDACRLLACLITAAIEGLSRDDLLSPDLAPAPGYWSERPLHPEIEAIRRGSYLEEAPPRIQGTGYAARSLEAALWAFSRARSFEKGCLLAVNLGDDADTTGAVYGQLAGAFYGEDSIPPGWRERLAHRGLIEDLAERLLSARSGRIAGDR